MWPLNTGLTVHMSQMISITECTVLTGLGGGSAGAEDGGGGGDGESASVI